MTCREFVEFLWRYLDENLSPTERTTFDEHIAKCPHCTRYLQQYQTTRQLSKAAIAPSEGPVSTDVPENLFQAIFKTPAR